MLRLGAIAIGILLLAVVALFLVVDRIVDPRDVADLLESEIERATRADVTLGTVEFSLLPMPELRVAPLELRHAETGGIIAAAEEVRISVSLLSALFGRVILSGVELRAPRVHLALDSEGRPILPLAAAGGASGGAPSLAIRSIRIDDGTVEIGPWKLERIFISGSLGVDLAVTLEGRLDLAGVGRLREQSVRISGLLGDEIEIEVGGELQDFDLAALARLLGRDEVDAGSLSGSYLLRLEGARLRSARADLLARALRVTSGGVRVEGDVPVHALAGGRWRVDLGAAIVEVDGALHKPAGEELALSGAAPTSDAPLAGLVLHVGGSELPLRWEDGALHAGPGTLALEGVSSWLAAEVSGEIAIDALEIRPRPLALRGGGELIAVEVALGNGVVSLTGGWQAEATTLSLPELEVKIAEQVFATSLAYDLSTGRLAARARASGAQVEPVLLAARGRAELTGALTLDARVEGPLDLRQLAGGGSFEISDGELRGFSILEQVLGELAKFPVLLAAASGGDLSKFDEERFESIAAVFTLRGARIHVQPLTARYRSGTALLWGTIGVADGALDLRGRIELSREVDEELTGEAPDEPTVIPVEAVRGTIARPRLILDRDAVAGVATTLATRGELGRKLDDTLGPGGAEAVQQILDQLLRGGRRRAP